ncbi:MAG: metal ABC transporter permease [Rickettsiales bacterium]|nr:metal ABC transporter permease [Rickettsiales bacterium]
MELLSIIIPALLAGFLIATTHGLLGVRVLKKGIIFMDLAIAQIAGLGLIVAVKFFPEIGFLQQLIAAFFALIAAFGFYYCEKFQQNIQEAIIGCSYILTATLSLLFLVDNPHAGDEMTYLLSGQILFITIEDVLLHAPIYFLTIYLWFKKPAIQNNIFFYLIFAFVITSSVQLVGVYVVFASLILPAILSFFTKHSVKSVWLSGYISVLLGLLSALIFDLPAGILIVISYFIVCIGFVAIKAILKNQN